jgi:hypothetical protein
VTTTTTTTTTTTKPCTQCTNTPSAYMLHAGIKCEWNMGVHYNCDNSKWVSNKFCQKTCFHLGKGYPGDNCCSDRR